LPIPLKIPSAGSVFKDSGKEFGDMPDKKKPFINPDERLKKMGRAFLGEKELEDSGDKHQKPSGDGAECE
jgi:hypothetical protein